MAILVRCVAAVAALFLLAACSSSGGEQDAEMTTVISTVTSTSAKPATAKSSSSAAESAVPAVRSEEGSEGKKFVECIYGGGNWTGTAWFADGTTGPYPECEELRSEVLRKNPYRCPGTDYQVPDPYYCSHQNEPFRTPAPNRERSSAPIPEPAPAPVPSSSQPSTAAPSAEPEPSPAPSAATDPLPGTDTGFSR